MGSKCVRLGKARCSPAHIFRAGDCERWPTVRRWLVGRCGLRDCGESEVPQGSEDWKTSPILFGMGASVINNSLILSS